MIRTLRTRTKMILLVSTLISTGIVVFIAFTANRNLVRLSANNTELYSAYRISELMKSFRAGLSYLDNRRKGYIITGDPKFLEEYRTKESETRTALQSMEQYFSGRPEQPAFYRLRELTYQKLAASKNLQGSFSGEGFRTDTPEELEMGTGDAIRALTDTINESLSLTKRTLLSQSNAYVEVSRRWSFLEVALGIMVALVGVLIVFRDIDLRNKLEEELRRAKKQADDNAMLKEQFMANMSHEIRTPMNAILGFTDLMYKTPLSSEQSEYINAIKTSGSGLLSIINDILDFSKIEAGMYHIESLPFDPYALFDSIRVMFGQKAAEKGIRLDVSLDSHVPSPLFGDPTRLTQVLVNLVNNAIKFTAQGHVKLHGHLHSTDPGRVQLRFVVSDTGIGIAPEKIGSVFERFNQGNKDTTRLYGGTGLGLAIVKTLVDAQQGSIVVNSALGKGAEFVVTLPYRLGRDSQGKQHSANLLTEYKLPAGYKVLLAEDNELNQRLAKRLLEGFGLEVDIAPNGERAIELMRSTTYHLMLTDIQMPFQDGYETARRVRNELKLRLPIIAMTAHIMPGEREKCLRYGMNDYISKPFREQELFEMMQRFLGQATTRTSATTQIDLRELYEMSRGNTAFVKDMIELFLDRNPKDLASLDEAFSTSDYDTLRAIAHRMKTSVGFMGLVQLLTPLDEIEQQAERGESNSRTGELLDQIRSLCNLARESFITELKRLESELST